MEERRRAMITSQQGRLSLLLLLLFVNADYAFRSFITSKSFAKAPGTLKSIVSRSIQLKERAISTGLWALDPSSPVSSSTDISLSNLISGFRSSAELRLALRELKTLQIAEAGGEVLGISDFNLAIEVFGKSKHWELAFATFQAIQASARLKPDSITYENILWTCTKNNQHQQLRDIFEEVLESTEKPTLDMYKAVLESYKTTGRSRDALALLEKIHIEGAVRLDAAAYTNAMAACVAGQRPGEALALYAGPHLREALGGLPPDAATLGVAIKAHAQRGDFPAAAAALAAARAAGAPGLLPAYNAALLFFGVRRKLWKESLQLLESMEAEGPAPDMTSYNLAMKACGRAAEWDEVVRFFLRLSDPAAPAANPRTYATALQGARRARRWEDALALYDLMAADAEAAWQTPPEAFAAALEACEHLGSDHWQRAVGILDRIPWPTPGDIATAIRCCNAAGKYGQAFELYEKANSFEEMPRSSNLYAAIMDTYLKVGQQEKVMQLFAEMKDQGVDVSGKVYGAVIAACKKLGNSRDAMRMLKEMQRKGITPSLINFTDAIAACSKTSDWLQATQIIQEMRRQGITPDGIAYGAAIRVCSECRQGDKALELFWQARQEGIDLKGDRSYDFAARAAVQVHSWPKALEILGEARDQGRATVKTYDIMITACAQFSMVDKIVEIMLMMKEDGIVPDIKIYSSIMKAYTKAGYNAAALDLFAELQSSKQHEISVSLYQSAVRAAASLGEWNKITSFLGEMYQSGLRPNGKTLASVMHEMAAAGEAARALRFLEQVRKGGWEDAPVRDAAVRLLGRPNSGAFAGAREAFDRLQADGKTPSMEAHKTLIANYKEWANWQACIDLVKNMLSKGMTPDEDCLVLTVEACMLDDPPQFKRALSLIEILSGRGGGQRGGRGASARAYNAVLREMFARQKWSSIESVYKVMVDNKVPFDKDTFSQTLKAFALSGAFAKAERVYLLSQKYNAGFEASELSSILETLIISALGTRNYGKVLQYLSEQRLYQLSLNQELSTLVLDSLVEDGLLSAGSETTEGREEEKDVLKRSTGGRKQMQAASELKTAQEITELIKSQKEEAEKKVKHQQQQQHKRATQINQVVVGADRVNADDSSSDGKSMSSFKDLEEDFFSSL